MPEFSIIRIEEAQQRLRPQSRKPYLEEYIGYLAHLRRGEAGVLTLTAQDTLKPLSIKNRLRQAAAELQLPLIVRASGNTVFFWPEQQTTVQQRRQRRRGEASASAESGTQHEEA
jgi:hypothetical protein